MKRITFFLSILISLCSISCSHDDKSDFNTAIDNSMFVFNPVEGGAVLHYKLSDPNINRVKVQYTDEFGSPVYKIGDYSVDTLLLDGFNSAQSDVPVKISFLDRNGKQSEDKILKFNTLPSNLYTFFDNVQVTPYWEGFQVTYELQGLANGSATVSFIGENPNTHAVDTLTLENFQLESGKFTKAYTLDASQQQSSYTIVITTEDKKQRIAKKVVWKGITGIEREILPNKDFELLDPFNKSNEKAYTTTTRYNPGALGKQYLFDGDTKGTRSAERYASGWATPPYTFLAGPNALHTAENNVYFVLDLKRPAMLGEMRFYAKYPDGYATNQDFGSSASSYLVLLPCAIKVYAWTDANDYNPQANQATIPASNWKLMGTYAQDPNAKLTDRWYCNKAKQQVVTVKTITDLNALAPLYVSVPFTFDTNEYRYYKIEFETTYRDLYSPVNINNNNNMVSCHEIEVYAKKE